MVTRRRGCRTDEKVRPVATLILLAALTLFGSTVWAICSKNFVSGTNDWTIDCGTYAWDVFLLGAD